MKIKYSSASILMKETHLSGPLFRLKKQSIEDFSVHSWKTGSL